MKRVATKARGLVKAAKEITSTRKRVRHAKLQNRQDALTQERYLRKASNLPAPARREFPKEQLRPRTRSESAAAAGTRASASASASASQTRCTAAGTDTRLATETGTGVLGKRRRAMGQNTITIHEDVQQRQQQHQQHQQQHGPPRKLRKMSATERMQIVSSDDDEEEEEDGSSASSDSDDEVDESVMEDMRRLEESFTGISQKYRLINRIGEGTFSTVYKAEQLSQPEDDDGVDTDPSDTVLVDAPPSKRRRLAPSSDSTLPHQKQKPQFVALKKIYVTSSPLRILNELELLHELRRSPYICPLLTAFRHQDQVVAVLPYFRHLDFRLYYREFITNDMRLYFRSLLNGLGWVHRSGILHRDIKPTNFLYDHTKRHGVLVDFGLAERQGTDWQHCICLDSKEKRKEKFINSYVARELSQKQDQHSDGYPKHDSRPSRRANRAGTRGFRAPEVLFKCTAQTTKIDIWSTGVILLTLLAKRFPFFNSADDVDAMIEMSSIFGKRRMQATAAMHGQVYETNIETIGDKGFTFEKLVLWAACREKPGMELRIGEQQAIGLLTGLMELDPHKRWSAKEALNHEFFVDPVEDQYEKEEREEAEAAMAESTRRGQ